jgi:dTDP-4-amino-4,6-dideoxygalactose transaminase
LLEKIDKSRDQIFNEMRENGVGVNVHYIPIHFHPFYERKGFKKGDFKESESYYKSVITIPLFPGLTSEIQNDIFAKLKKILA